MKLLPKSRRGRVAVVRGLVGARLALYWYVFEYRPWEAHYLGRPTSWWAREYDEPYCPLPGRVGALGLLEEWLGRVGIRLPGGPVDTRLLEGDPEAVPVLTELLRRPE